MSTNPYAPPNAPLREAHGGAPLLWNPNAAANWSLLLTPMFGALIQMLNWQMLGESRHASVAKAWAVVGLVLILLNPVLLRITAPIYLYGSLRWILLVAWYFANGRPQARYVEERFGGDYPRRNWGLPILCGLAAEAAFTGLAWTLSTSLEKWIA